MRLPHKRQTAGRSVVACDSNSARTLGQVFPSQQVMLNEQRQQGNAAQWGRDAFGTATRISASLLRRLSAFFRSVSDQDPKAAKFVVLNPGHAGFPKRVERSESSDTTPPPKTPPVSACEPLCAIFLREPGVYPFLPMKAKMSRLWEKLKDAMKSGWGIKFIAAALPDFSRLLVLWVHRGPGNVCI